MHGIPSDELAMQQEEAMRGTSIVELRAISKIRPEEVLDECLRREASERKALKECTIAYHAGDCLAVMSALYALIGEIVCAHPSLVGKEVGK